MKLAKSEQISHQPTRVQSEKTIRRLENDFDRETDQQYFTIVQMIVKADRAKLIAWCSVTCKMTCYHVLDEKKFKFSVCISFPLCSLHSTCCTYCAFCIRSAVCILYWYVTVAPIQFIFGYSRSHNTHNRPQNTFPFFSALTLFPLYNNIDITYNVSIVPPTQKYNSCMHAYAILWARRHIQMLCRS